MVVDVEIWYWTKNGMTQTPQLSNKYVTVQDCERLLEEAHARAYRQGFGQGKQDHLKIPL
jgi:hypothetical protein